MPFSEGFEFFIRCIMLYKESKVLACSKRHCHEQPVDHKTLELLMQPKDNMFSPACIAHCHSAACQSLIQNILQVRTQLRKYIIAHLLLLFSLHIHETL